MKLHVSIRTQAQKLDINQTEIAKLTGLHRATINKLWRGKGLVNAHFPTLEKIAEVLHCSPLEFFSVTDD